MPKHTGQVRVILIEADGAVTSKPYNVRPGFRQRHYINQFLSRDAPNEIKAPFTIHFSQEDL